MRAMDDKESQSLPGSETKLRELSVSDVALSPLNQVPPCHNVWLKLDLFLLPVVTLIFFLSFLVRACPSKTAAR